MRSIFIVVVSSLLLTGCKHTQPSESSAKTSETVVKPKKAEKSSTAVPKATPINEPAGKIASVNASLRFVVIDFSLNPIPAADQRLGVYRQGQKVGEVKVSKEMRNSIVAADITAGEARIGDEVRAQ